MDSNLILDQNNPKYSVIKNIIDNATEAFINYGIKSVTMDEIASSTGISKRTLYQLFKDKEELLLGTIINSQIEMRKFVEDILQQTDNVLEIILRCYKYSVRQYQKTDKRFFEDLVRYPEAYKILLRGQQRDTSQTIAFFKKGVEQGLFRGDINFEIFNDLMREQFNIFLESNIFVKYPFMEIYKTLMFTHFRGISTAKGALELENFINEYRNEKF